MRFYNSYHKYRYIQRLPIANVIKVVKVDKSFSEFLLIIMLS